MFLGKVMKKSCRLLRVNEDPVSWLIYCQKTIKSKFLCRSYSKLFLFSKICNRQFSFYFLIYMLFILINSFFSTIIIILHLLLCFFKIDKKSLSAVPIFELKTIEYYFLILIIIQNLVNLRHRK